MLEDLGKLGARLTFGGVMLVSHGIPKLMGFSQLMNSFPDPLGIGNSLSLGLAIFAEVLCALLLALGLFTRLTAVPLAFTMVVAGVFVHASDPWKRKELAFIYLFGYIICALLGSGKLSLDFLLRKKT
jgi:putative oxidoreductase